MTTSPESFPFLHPGAPTASRSPTASVPSPRVSDMPHAGVLVVTYLDSGERDLAAGLLTALNTGSEASVLFAAPGAVAAASGVVTWTAADRRWRCGSAAARPMLRCTKPGPRHVKGCAASAGRER